jgi:hypothetical protein
MLATATTAQAAGRSARRPEGGVWQKNMLCPSSDHCAVKRQLCVRGKTPIW